MITSTGNDRVRAVSALTRKAKERTRQDAFVVEGIKMFREAPPHMIREAFVTEAFLRIHGDELPEETVQLFLRGGRYEIVSEQAFAAMSDTQTPQGILCVAAQQHWTKTDLLAVQQHGTKADLADSDSGGAAGDTDAADTVPEKAPLVMVLEDLQDPGNLGTIVRTSEGAGVTGILMSKRTVDIYNPKVTRSTMGSLYRVPFFYSEDLHGDIRWLRQQGLKVCAAHLRGQNSYEHESYLTGTAFLIGNESRGLKEETARLADTYIRIPMLGQVESLNAAVASAILMYEAARQRRSTAQSAIIQAP